MIYEEMINMKINTREYDSYLGANIIRVPHGWLYIFNNYHHKHSQMIGNDDNAPIFVAEHAFISSIHKSELITIKRSEYDELTKNDLTLNCLIANGVDNWPGYEDAISDMEEYDK